VYCKEVKVEAIGVDGAESDGTAIIFPAPSKSTYPMTTEGWDAVVVVVVVPVPAVVPVPVVVVLVEALFWIEAGVRTKPYKPLRFETEHPF